MLLVQHKHLIRLSDSVSIKFNGKIILTTKYYCLRVWIEFTVCNVNLRMSKIVNLS